MGEIRLFHVIYDGVHELGEHSFAQERELQKLFEAHLHDLTGIEFLDSEYITSRGRIDTLGIDDRDCPVVIEYKRGLDENVINQGVRYLNWLKGRDNQENFRRLVREMIAPERVKGINFKGAWLLCVAGDFPGEDVDAAENSKARVELVRYRRFGHDLDLLMLEWVFPQEPESQPLPPPPDPPPVPVPPAMDQIDDFGNPFSINSSWQRSNDEIRELFLELLTQYKSLGGDVQLKASKSVFSFKRGAAKRHSVFTYAHLRTKSRSVLLAVPVSVSGKKRQYQDVKVSNRTDFEKVKPLLRDAYDQIRL